MTLFSRRCKDSNTDPTTTTDLLVDRWENGYERGRRDQRENGRIELEKAKDHSYEMGWKEGNRLGRVDQKEQDNIILERAITDAYVAGYDKGFDKEEAATIRTLTELEAIK